MKMKIFLIIDEFPFFLPDYLDKVIEKVATGYEIIGITPLINPKGKPTFSSYLINQLPKLGLRVCIQLFLKASRIEILSVLFQLKLSSRPQHISQVARKYGISIYKSKNVNDSTYLDILDSLQPDIIISSCSQIFKKRLLQLPQTACINRHSGLLPSYGGLFPVFQAMIHDEEYAGVTIHTMVEEIDKGKIISQIKIPITKWDTLFSLYEKSYHESITATIEALNKLERKNPHFIKPFHKSSYFSFPTSSDWEKFWKKKKRVI